MVSTTMVWRRLPKKVKDGYMGLDTGEENYEDIVKRIDGVGKRYARESADWQTNVDKKRIRVF